MEGACGKTIILQNGKLPCCEERLRQVRPPSFKLRIYGRTLGLALQGRFFCGAGSSQSCGQLLSAFALIAPNVPELCQSARYSQSYLRCFEPFPSSTCLLALCYRRVVCYVSSPAQRRPEIIVLVLQPVHPHPLVWAYQVRFGLLRKRHEIAGVLLETISFL